jgi:hypothetical protein
MMFDLIRLILIYCDEIHEMRFGIYDDGIWVNSFLFGVIVSIGYH